MRYATILLAAAGLVSAAAHARPGDEMRARHDGIAGPLVGTIEGDLSGDRPAVLIIPGSGPTDRDGNSPLGVNAATYRLLAERLAEREIASVRIDKRGMFASAAADDGNAVTVGDYVADIEAWSAAIAERRKGECIWLLGHSEGGLMAMAAAASDPSPYCGLLLVAAPGRKLSDTLRAQLRANPANAPLLDQADAAIASLESGNAYDTADLHPALQPLFAPQVQRFLMSVFAQDPAQLVRAHDLPILILQGTTDLQIGQEDADILANARPDATLVMLDGVNHVLKEAPEDRAANLATYADPDLPLPDDVVRVIADFLEANS